MTHTNTRSLIKRLAVLLAVPAALVVGAHLNEQPAEQTTAVVTASSTSQTTEGGTGWDCRTIGIQVCGAHNGQGVPAGEYGRFGSRPIVLVPADDAATAEGVAALLAAGYMGDPNDNTEAVYAPANTVLDVPGGTWTVTVDGLARCVDWFTTSTECTGTEYLS